MVRNRWRRRGRVTTESDTPGTDVPDPESVDADDHALDALHEALSWLVANDRADIGAQPFPAASPN